MMRHLCARNLRRELLGADWDSMTSKSLGAGIFGACCNPPGLTDLQDLPDF